MASTIKTFLEEINEIEYQLIAIHTSLEDYRLAYFINKELTLNLTKCNDDLHVIVKQGETNFARFHFDDESKSITWNLIENKSNFINTENLSVKDLFSMQENAFSSTTYLIPEYKKVNFFLKIESENNLKLTEFVKKINAIDKIALVYSVDKDKIKSKINLIF